MNFSVRSELLSPRDPQLMDPSLPPCLGQRIVVAMRDCDLRGEDYLSYFPLTAPIWIVGSIVVRPADCLRSQPTPH